MMLICLLNLQNLSLTGPMYNVLPPIIMVLWRMGPYKTTCSFLYNRVIFHFHDYGRKGNRFGFLYLKNLGTKKFSKDCHPKPLDPRIASKKKKPQNTFELRPPTLFARSCLICDHAIAWHFHFFWYYWSFFLQLAQQLRPGLPVWVPSAASSAQTPLIVCYCALCMRRMFYSRLTSRSCICRSCLQDGLN